MWFNTSGNLPTSSGYYSATVNVGATANSVAVNLRGSVNSCAKTGSYTAFAVDVRSDGPNAGRLTAIQGSTLNRGTLPGQSNRWSSQGSSLGATLNVQGLATNNAGRVDTQTITINIYRCFSTNGIRPTGGCASTPVPVTITRAAGPGFELTTALGGNTQVSEPGATVTLQPSVINRGPTASSSAQWQIIRRVVGAGVTMPGAGASTSLPISHYGFGSEEIGGGSRVFARGTFDFNGFGTIMPDAPLDSRVCYALSVRPHRDNDARWYHGPPFCVTVSKSPKIQVIGGDVIVGSGAASSDIATTAIRKNVSDQNRTFGSWGEYGVMANGRIVGMASGAGYSGGATGNFCSVSLLTLTNAGTNVCNNATPKGGYAANAALPDISSRFTSTNTINLGATATINVADPNLISGIYTASDRITVLNSSSIPVGKWIVINAPNADVEITQDLTYSDGPISSIEQIPQLIIIADTIAIASNVTRVDAWLVANGATGSINTCSEISNPANPASPLTANRCNQLLTINGPVIAERLFLYRTSGAGTGQASGDPAEVFNLRPDAYLWATHYTSTGGRVPTVNTRELPPRF